MTLSNTVYTNPAPMPTTLGGLPSGTTFNNEPIHSIINKLLYPYQYPAFTSFTITGQTNPLEVGATTLSNPTFTWGTSNNSNINLNSISITDVTGGGTVLASGLDNDGTETVTLAGIQKTTATSHIFRITGVNTLTENFTRDLTLNWRWRFYYGESLNATLNEAEIKALRVGTLGTGFAGTYNFVAGGYKYLCYPQSWGNVTEWKDASNNLLIPLGTPFTVSVTNANGIATTFICYRSFNILGGAITAIAS